MDKLISISESINRLLERLAKGAGLLFLLTIAVIVFDVLSRKIGFQMPGLGSTRLQELEWHLHTALFSFWLGVAYVKNAHVRIDILVAGLKPKTKAWTELIGCFVFAIPYLSLLLFDNMYVYVCILHLYLASKPSIYIHSFSLSLS